MKKMLALALFGLTATAPITASGVSRMHHIDVLDLAPGTPITFAPGGMHLMLMGLTGKLEEDRTFPLTLSFEHAGEITVEVPVLSVTATGPKGAE